MKSISFFGGFWHMFFRLTGSHEDGLFPVDRFFLWQNFDLESDLSRFTFPIKRFLQEFYAAGFKYLIISEKSNSFFLFI